MMMIMIMINDDDDIRDDNGDVDDDDIHDDGGDYLVKQTHPPFSPPLQAKLEGIKLFLSIMMTAFMIMGV